VQEAPGDRSDIRRRAAIRDDLRRPNVIANASRFTSDSRGTADGNTPEKCYEATQEALTVAVATMLEAGQTPPQPAAFMKRNTQVNVRLTHEEKILIANAATRAGFKGLADFIRTTVLDRALFNR